MNENFETLRDTQNLTTLNTMGKTLDEALKSLEELTRQANHTVNQIGWGNFSENTEKDFTGSQSSIFKHIHELEDSLYVFKAKIDSEKGRIKYGAGE